MIAFQFTTLEDMAKYADTLANRRKAEQPGETNQRRSARLSGEIAAYTYFADVIRNSTILELEYKKRQEDLIDNLFFA